MNRPTCPTHGWSRAARRHRRAMADHDAAAHIAWAARLRVDDGRSRRVYFSAWEPVYRDLTGEGDMVLSHLEVAIYREDGTREVVP